MKKLTQIITGIFLLCFSYSVYSIEWDGVKSKQVTLFYPGQASWEWVLTKSTHAGAKNFRAGKDCRECHQDEEKDMGNLIVSGKKLEPDPIKGKRGYIDVDVKTAYDKDRFYIQLSWADSKGLTKSKMAKDQSKVTVLFDDGNVKEVKRAGCWGACHDDATHMPSAQHGKNLSIYLSKSRTKITRKGGGENYKSNKALQQLLDDGFYAEYWQAKLNKTEPVSVLDAYILDKRHENESARVKATADLKKGIWTVELSRELIPNSPLYKNIVAGKTYTFGLAIHDAYSHGRHHHVSFNHTFKLDEGTADFIAIKQ